MKTLKKNSGMAGLLLMICTFLFSIPGFAQDGRLIEIKGLNNMTFDVTEIVAKPGEKLTVRLTTVTDYTPRQMSHNWVLLKQTANVQKFVDASEKSAINDFIAPKLEDQTIAHTAMASGGETVEVTFYAPDRPSKYMYICTFPGHFFAGMMGTLTVKE